MISNSFTDYMCPICLQILIEPVVMPCEHELCRPCFKKNVEEANFVCPLCRMRISSWARRNTRKGTLVDLKRWEQIQRLFPEKCQKRLRGEDEEDLFDFPAPKRTISKDGEIRKEYEEEMRKVQQAREQEMKASEEAVRQLQEEEERLAQTLDFQAQQDEELARKIVSEENPQNPQEKEQLSQSNLLRKSVAGSNASLVKGKKKNQASHGCSTLDKWFSPTRNPAVLDRQVTNTRHKEIRNQTTGLGKRKQNKTNENGSFLTSTSMDTERFTCISNDVHDLHYCQVFNEKKEQENQDFQLALKLQKEFDSIWKKEAMVDRKKGTVDAYLLRKTENNSTSTQSGSSKHRNFSSVSKPDEDR